MMRRLIGTFVAVVAAGHAVAVDVCVDGKSPAAAGAKVAVEQDGRVRVWATNAISTVTLSWSADFAPDNLVDGYAQAHRIEQQRADDATKDFVKWVKAQKLIKAVLAGHVHHTWQERVSDSAVQYICGATYKGDAQLLEFC